MKIEYNKKERDVNFPRLMQYGDIICLFISNRESIWLGYEGVTGTGIGCIGGYEDDLDSDIEWWVEYEGELVLSN